MSSSQELLAGASAQASRISAQAWEGVAALPGLTPAVTVGVAFALFWVAPFSLCLAQLLEGCALRLRYKELGRQGVLTGLLGALGLAVALCMYLLAVASILPMFSPQLGAELALAHPTWAAATQAGARLGLLLGAELDTLRIVPLAVLYLALLSHLAAMLLRWALNAPLRRVRHARATAVLDRMRTVSEEERNNNNDFNSYW